MGTRNLVAVQHKGKYKVAQYGQWDGYPSGQGMTVKGFLEKMDREAFLKNLDQCRFVSDEELETMWQECGKKPDDQWVDMTVSARFNKGHPALSRDTGGDVLKLIANDPQLLRDSITFAADSLFCEWAYVIDFDKETFEVYKGFNKAPLAEGERFFYYNDKAEIAAGGDTYYPVKLVASYPLSALPSDDDFLLLDKGEEE